jgi:DNA topoisomerase-1
VLAALALQEFEKFDSETQAKKNIVRAIESVAEKLGNTPTICRKCYVHPAVLDAYLEGAPLDVMRERTEEKLAEDLHALQPEEAAVLAMLQQRLRHEEEKPRKKAPAKEAPAKKAATPQRRAAASGSRT